jgi:hypothetical protein
VARVGHILSLIATTLAVFLAALALGTSIVVLVFFVFLVHHLVFQIGLANWSSLGLAALFLGILGGIWLMGNSLLDIVAGVGFRVRQRTAIILPWLGIAAFIGMLFVIFGE